MNPNNSSHIKERWEAEIQQQIFREDWGEICSEAHMETNANIWREFKWKVIPRYFRPSQITADKCWRNCGTHIDNQLHIFWSKMKTTLGGDLPNLDVPQDPPIALPGFRPEGIELLTFYCRFHQLQH